MTLPNYGGENKLFLFGTVLIAKSGKRVPVQLSAVPLWECP
jgi:hypothetical protein